MRIIYYNGLQQVWTSDSLNFRMESDGPYPFRYLKIITIPSQFRTRLVWFHQSIQRIYTEFYNNILDASFQIFYSRFSFLTSLFRQTEISKFLISYFRINTLRTARVWFTRDCICSEVNEGALWTWYRRGASLRGRGSRQFLK